MINAKGRKLLSQSKEVSFFWFCCKSRPALVRSPTNAHLQGKISYTETLKKEARMKSNFYKDVLKKVLAPLVVIGATILMPLSCYADGERIVFLHHSTGNNVYYDGKITGWFSNYNKANRTSFQITERFYPNSPYPWQNYPYDYWNLWVNGACNSNNANVECISTLTKKYDVIIYKHCFPGSHIEPDRGSPTLNSQIKNRLKTTNCSIVHCET